ncbi:hypothetical protein [uncultured Aquimarina sp.]|uniref:hypothetical protein n=1 Tax=uncultured Aquimarina sp. TaxID=575652 RepID=UPI002639219D|nr:hypothetical protein [uncultured Aquimarina sp.]
MTKKLPSLNSTDKELEKIYTTHSNDFFDWLEKNSISPNSSRDIAMLAHNELVKRSNNRFSNFSKILTIAVFILSFITVIFAFRDYSGDKEWQKQQITELEKINSNLTERNKEIESLNSTLNEANRKIELLEKRIKLYEKKVELKKK